MKEQDVNRMVILDWESLFDTNYPFQSSPMAVSNAFIQGKFEGILEHNIANLIHNMVQMYYSNEQE